MNTRKELNLSQKQLAELLELDELTIKFLEYGDPLWDTKMLKKKIKKATRNYK
jgi:DNA-binding XRE family transcriptional regulator